ncbi:MAG: site-specific DNA-methyltransferase [Chloroflexi bacterium]|nr:site-specific DNA-methyltransferase [Ardenticatenaceae bacterium]MBL1128134.1 site-specific DNA-methyltransferase [Chloroflexota bacterium]NOG34205.1 site-specific DNA-methyltransferase [Chloroflexota bacterium]
MVMNLEYKGEQDNALSLVYKNKQPESQVLLTEPGQYKCLYQKDNHNRLYYGDNLPILASLYRNPSIRGQVRLVYIDPPYATGNVFQSRNQEDAYTDLLAGARYVEFMRQRLILLRELLAEDGSIYIHLDANMVFHIKIIMDEIFGARQFRGFITRKKCNPKNYTRKTYGSISDYILFYTKSDNYVWHRPYDDWTSEDIEKEYQYIEEGTGRRYKKVPVHAPGVRNGATGQPWRGKMPPPGKHWQYTPDKLDDMDARGEIYWSPTGNPRRKVYLDGSQGKPVQDIWLDFKDAHNQNIQITGYPTEKNPDLLARIIQASSNPEDIVLDCFASSGTTLLAANQLNRRWIGVDDSQHALETILKRLAIGSEAMGDFVTRNGQNKKRVTSEPQPRTLWEIL